MIRSSKHSLKYANQGKRETLAVVIREYRRLLGRIINDLWFGKLHQFNLDIKNNKLSCPKMLPSNYLNQFDTWFSARMAQCVGKQACSMVRSAVQKRKQQLFILTKLQRKGAKAGCLQSKIDCKPLVIPNANNAKMELDPRFVDFTYSSKEFDIIVGIKTIGTLNNEKVTLKIPIKYTKVSNKWMARGQLKESIRISEHDLWLIYEIADSSKKTTGKIVGADQGQLTILTLSDSQTTSKDIHGWDLNKIQDRLSRRRKGSKAFKRSQEHRKNHIHWALNQLDYSDIKELRLEKIRGIRFKRRYSRKMSHWAYTAIKSKLASLSETEGFRFTEIANEFRSQRCSNCGWVRKANRKGKTFKCSICGKIADADLNAASNLTLDLYEIPLWVRLGKLNLSGFFWKSDGLFALSHEPIVRDPQKEIA